MYRLNKFRIDYTLNHIYKYLIQCFMKRFFTLLTAVLFTAGIYSQSPSKLSYQGVIRNASGILVQSSNVGIKISILQGSTSGAIVYSETQVVATNSNGLATCEIGGGTPISGTFTTIDWSAGPYFLKTETDPTGGTSYSITGTSQLLSVPYALHAKTAENGFSGNYNDLSNKPALFSGAYSSLTGAPTLATVAITGSYLDLTNKPSLFSGVYSDLTGKPTLFDGNYNSLTNKPALFDGNYNSLSNLPVLFNGTWSSLTGKPTTIAGYGITDANVYSDALVAAEAASRIVADAATLSSANSYTDAETAVRSASVSAEAAARIAGDINLWSLTGNSGTTDGTNFIGTIDDIPLVLKINNGKAGRIETDTWNGNNFGNAFFGYLAGSLNTTGYYNTASGSYALYSNTTGNGNTANGGLALYSNTLGTNNTANGFHTLNDNTTGSYNTATGAAALMSNTTGNFNTANGNEALNKNLTGYSNTAVGVSALTNNTTGANNTANGYNSLMFNTSGNQNAAFGFDALQHNTTGNSNTANGEYALSENTIGIANTAYGSNTLTNNITGNLNTALGSYANVSTDGLSNATAIGSGAIVNENNTIQLGNSSVTQVFAGTGSSATIIAGGLKITGGSPAAGKILTSDASGVATWQVAGGGGWGLTGNSGTVDGTNFIGTTDNIPFNIRVNNQKAGRIDVAYKNSFYGYQSGNSNTTGQYNTAIGFQSLISGNTGNYNTSIGSSTLVFNATGSYNVALGTYSLNSNVAGSNATAVGYKAMYYSNNTSSPFDNNNVAIGYEALRGSTSSSANTGVDNTAIGFQTLWSNTDGFRNSATGERALYSNTSGYANTANGWWALILNTNGIFNTALGAEALYNNTAGFSNTGEGYQALTSNTSGNFNTALGYQAGKTATSANANTTGSNNTFIGSNSGPGTSTQLTNATAIGYNALVSADNSLVLGGTGTDAVKVGIGVKTPSATLDILGNIKIKDGNQGAGKVLTSDANGLATWAPAGGGGSTHTIGESYGGGIVFYVYDGGQHGLIAAPADFGTLGMQWYNGSYTTTNAVRNGIGAGKFNTERIIANQGVGSYPAQLCANYQGGNYGDWYLPSIFELNLLYLQKSVVGGFSSYDYSMYWSSTENDSNGAWSQSLYYGYQQGDDKSATAWVRAIRSF